MRNIMCTATLKCMHVHSRIGLYDSGSGDCSLTWTDMVERLVQGCELLRIWETNKRHGTRYGSAKGLEVQEIVT